MKTKNGVFKENTNELIQYTKKGTKLIRQIRVAYEIFNEFYEDFKRRQLLATTKSLEVFNNAAYGLWQKGMCLYYESQNQETQAFRIICPGIFIAFNDFCETKYPNLYNYTKRGNYDYILVCDFSCNKEDIDKGIDDTCPMQVRNWGKKVIEKHYTKEEVQAIIDSCPETRPNPFAMRQTTHNDKVVEWNDCVYQDIHKAHNSELTFNLFPKCPEFMKMFKNATYFKSIGDTVKAKTCKDYPNLLVGCFNQRYREGEHEGEIIPWLYGLDAHKIYNQIVTNIYNKEVKHYNELSTFCSTLVYAQTDSMIISHPNWSKVKDSDALGEYGTEPIDNKRVWTYHQATTKETSGYTIYQYFENGKKKVVGDLPNELKQHVDLSKGQVVHYKRTRDENKCVKFTLIDIYTTDIIKGE